MRGASQVVEDGWWCLRSPLSSQSGAGSSPVKGGWSHRLKNRTIGASPYCSYGYPDKYVTIPDPARRSAVALSKPSLFLLPSESQKSDMKKWKKVFYNVSSCCLCTFTSLDNHCEHHQKDSWLSYHLIAPTPSHLTLWPREAEASVPP